MTLGEAKKHIRKSWGKKAAINVYPSAWGKGLWTIEARGVSNDPLLKPRIRICECPDKEAALRAAVAAVEILA